MKQAAVGYWKILRESGLKRAIWSFYSYYYTKYKLKSAKKKGNFIVRTHGCKLSVIPDDDGLSSELLVYGYHEKDTTNFVSNYLKKDMVCIDIGANIGYYTTLYSSIVGPDGIVVAIEPSPLNYAYLQNNLKMQNTSNFITFNCACGENKGKVDFQIDSKANKCFVLNENEQPKPTTKVITVPIRTLDDIVNEIKLKKIDFLKIDVEGYEWNVIRGGWDTIMKFKPTLQIEIHHKRLGSAITKKLLTQLKEEGYHVIFHDIGGDEGTFFKRSTLQSLNIDDFLQMNMIKEHQRSFKLILKNNKK